MEPIRFRQPDDGLDRDFSLGYSTLPPEMTRILVEIQSRAAARRIEDDRLLRLLASDAGFTSEN